MTYTGAEAQTTTISEEIMNENTVGAQVEQRYWVGIDWGKSTHTVSVVDDRRSSVEQFSIRATLPGFAQLAEKLKRWEPIGGIAIESTRNLVVAYLLGEGYRIYPINPKLSKNWREGNSVAAVKSDERDPDVLALELARRHESLRPLEQAEPAVAELMALCENLRSLINQRSAHVKRLKDALGQYYPAALEFFTDWSSPVAWRFLKRFPTASSLSAARKTTLVGFLKANRIGLSPLWLERIERRSQATAWPSTPEAPALEAMALATVAQLLALQPHIDKLDHRIEEHTKALPHADLIRSLPGAGKRLAPALTAITGGIAATNGGYQALRCLTGVAPVPEQSGSRCRVRVRRRCNKRWRDTLHLFAFCSTRFCQWAKAFYDLCRERGNSHATALRKLADKWLKIICRMIDTGQPYDDKRYVECLRTNNSPVYFRLCGKSCA